MTPGFLERIDPVRKQAAGRVPFPSSVSPFGVAVGRGTVWVTQPADGMLWRVDARTGAVQGKPLFLGVKATFVAHDGEDL